MNKERKTLTHKFRDAHCRLPPCRAEGCCWVGDKFLAITKKFLEVGGYVQRWEDAAGGYRTQPHLHPTCGYHNRETNTEWPGWKGQHGDGFVLRYLDGWPTTNPWAEV